MPAYEYLCESCASHFERRQKMSDPEVASCPQCGGPVKRLISGGAGIISKGAASPSVGSGCEMGGCCAPDTGCGGGMCGYDN
ncbi:MAG TPA: zinc ribbon domain-containing protein [Terracidiphilus sp.]|nr:zinc ribbon domain-containing protein [Terracidiphilus sp.]